VTRARQGRTDPTSVLLGDLTPFARLMFSVGKSGTFWTSLGEVLSSREFRHRRHSQAVKEATAFHETGWKGRWWQKKSPSCKPNRSKLCPFFLRKTFTLIRNIGPFDTEVRTGLPIQALPRGLSHSCLPCAGRRHKILRARSPRPFPTRGSAPARA
jgi:hypothetical protein